jgi:hypothetical protein
LQLSEPVLENIADAYDPHELIALLDRHMANAPLTGLMWMTSRMTFTSKGSTLPFRKIVRVIGTYAGGQSGHHER